MNVRDLELATIEQLFEVCLFTEDNVLQLGAGPLGFTSTLVDLPGLGLEWNGVGASIRSREIYGGSGVMFGFVLDTPNPLKYLGHDVNSRDAVVWHPGMELDYIAPTGLASLVIHVDEALVDLLGWTLARVAWQQVPEARLAKLQETCSMATRWARRWLRRAGSSGEGTHAEVGAIRWRDRILTDLEAALEPWFRLPPAIHKSNTAMQYFRLVRDADRMFEQCDPSQPFAVDSLAQALGVSRRTVFHGFRKWLGVGPRTYLQLIKLHRLRYCLLAGSPADTSVTAIATELGFTHLGRMAEAYREHFGERPSETLKRRWP